jgi:hypothetical protein
MIAAEFCVSREGHPEPVSRGVIHLAALPAVGEIVTVAGDDFEVRRRHYIVDGAPDVRLYVDRLPKSGAAAPA